MPLLRFIAENFEFYRASLSNKYTTTRCDLIVNQRVSSQIDEVTQTSGEIKMKLEARAIKRILDRQSGNVVGWLYVWNTGEREPLWKDERCQDVIYE